MPSGDPIPSSLQAELIADLARRYRAPLWTFFEKRVRRVGPADIEDLVQEVFARLVQRPDLQAVGQIEGYLFQTAANLLRDRARRLEVRAADGADFSPQSPEEHEDITPERVLQGREALDRVIEALHQLPERTRTVFVLHRFEELRYDEIARRAGISLSSVEKHMMKAIAHIKHQLGRQE